MDSDLGLSLGVSLVEEQDKSAQTRLSTSEVVRSIGATAPESAQCRSSMRRRGSGYGRLNSGAPASQKRVATYKRSIEIEAAERPP